MRSVQVGIAKPKIHEQMVKGLVERFLPDEGGAIDVVPITLLQNRTLALRSAAEVSFELSTPYSAAF